MVVCPFCEHAQPESPACVRCGLPFGRGAPANAYAPLPGLEPHRAAPVDVPTPPLEGLERHVAPPLPVPVAPLEEIVPTAVEASGPVAVDPVPGMEQTRVAPELTPTPRAAHLTCRYCGFVQRSGRTCDRCGMQLPGFILRPAPEPETVARCPECGRPAAPGSRCSNCGYTVRK